MYVADQNRINREDSRSGSGQGFTKLGKDADAMERRSVTGLGKAEALLRGRRRKIGRILAYAAVAA
jgi:hypothetical protein